MSGRLRFLQFTLVVVFVGLPIGLYGIWLHQPPRALGRAEPATLQATRVTVSTPIPSPARPVVPSPTVTRKSSPLLRPDQLATVEAQLALVVNRQSPRAALAMLAQRMNTDPSVLRSCHALAHAIGHMAYAKYLDFATAVEYQDDICGSGYLHGVVEARFASVKDVYAEMRTICNAYVAINQAGKCLHGVGHGLMRVTNNNLPRSLELCDVYGLTIFKIRCSEGVFMENFGTDLTMHFSRYLKPNDPMYPCREQPGFYKGTCYYYAPLFYLNLHNGQYTDALHWCTTAELPYVETCVTGTGSRIMKQNIRRPQFVEHVCRQAGGRYINACIAGMVSYYLVNFNSFHRGEELCPLLDSIDRPACWSALESRRAIFPP